MGVQTLLMLDKLESLAARHEELLRGMADPQVLANPDRFQQLAREQASLAETVSTFREFQRVAREAEEAAAMAQGEQDPELREMRRVFLPANCCGCTRGTRSARAGKWKS